MPEFAVTADRGCRRRAWVALLLIVPAPSLGLLAALYLWPGPVGQGVYGLSRIWLIAVPLIWVKAVERTPWRVSRPTRRGVLAGCWTGLVLGAVILGAYALVGRTWIDAGFVRARIEEIGLGRPAIFLAGAVYWCGVNALIEEYVWRWFVFTRCEVLTGAGRAAALSAALFTLHHVVGLSAYVDLRLTVLGCAGVFFGGLTWSLLFRRHRSVWPGYISHIFADMAIFWIAWRMVFAGGG